MRYGSVVYGEMWYVLVFFRPAGEKGGCGFIWGYFKSVCGEPVRQSV